MFFLTNNLSLLIYNIICTSFYSFYSLFNTQSKVKYKNNILLNTEKIMKIISTNNLNKIEIKDIEKSLKKVHEFD